MKPDGIALPEVLDRGREHGRYFAEVLPQDTAKYVAQLQREGRSVCFIGDGVNDAIALMTANVSISLRGPSSVATDTAQVVFVEDNQRKLLALSDISRALPGTSVRAGR